MAPHIEIGLQSGPHPSLSGSYKRFELLAGAQRCDVWTPEAVACDGLHNGVTYAERSPQRSSSALLTHHQAVVARAQRYNLQAPVTWPTMIRHMWVYLWSESFMRRLEGV